MKPLYLENFIVPADDVCKVLFSEVDWLEKTLAKKESFMSFNPLEYTYGSGRGIRTYKSVEFHPLVLDIMLKMNSDLNREYNVCFLNLYLNEKNHLGWHSDNSLEMDSNHPIASVSFGEEREIWWRLIGEKGVISEENRKLLKPGSLFEMPAGFQEVYEHKIPKGSRLNMSSRISLTFRRFLS